MTSAGAGEPQSTIDLASERQRSPLSDAATQRALMTLVHGGEHIMRVREKVVAFTQQDPMFSRSEAVYFKKDRIDLYKFSLQRQLRYMALREAGPLKTWSNEEDEYFRERVLLFSMFHIHTWMFIPIVRTLGDDEQQRQWLPMAEKNRIIGCYAQTELGHGSNVRGLETTATLDRATDEFVIHTPTVTATKYWPGALGLTATHAVVYARLLIPHPSTNAVKDYGVHAFVVQIRSLDDHQLLRGITTGDIGAKLGSSGMDNGYCKFEHMRIPRRNMLMRFAKVSRNGDFTLDSASEKASYAAMMGVRTTLVSIAGRSLGMACTIAIRYCAVRRQFHSSESTSENELESPVLDYQAVQYRLFPLLAAAYAMIFAGHRVVEEWKAIFPTIAQGNARGIKEMHVILSGLKAVCTTLDTDGAEECRRACGGAGYSRYSGLPDIVMGAGASVTAEGENYMIIQQVSQHLIKVYQDTMAGRMPTDSCAYLGPLLVGRARDAVAWTTAAHCRSHQNLLKAFEVRAATKLRALGEAMTKLIQKDKISPGIAYARLQWDAIQVAFTHGLTLVFKRFIETLERENAIAAPLKAALDRLCSLFGCIYLEKDLADLLQTGYISPIAASLIHETIRQLMAEIRPDAVSLVDGFGFADYELRTAIGRYDGRVYETLLDWAQHEPLNGAGGVPSFAEYLQPILEGKAAQYARL